ncbi:Gibberellin 3-beta-dioxygenase 1 [Platanthera zijinensis]|uniref:Gibberellin 3-beta-dioxygenase 1 n=1 Tax=Platanthera zijinensis TaxID=2320716 RepID=A0AAP0BE28_9ASPA
MPSLPHEHYDLHTYLHVPESHVWPSSHLHDHPTAAGAGEIPVVDIFGPDAASLVGAACRSPGAFYATGHGVSPRLLGDVESLARRLFSLPLRRKLLVSRRPGSVSGYGRPPLSSFFPKFMWSEGFTLVGDPLRFASLLWPHRHHFFCEVMEEYMKEMKKVGERVMRLMLLSLGLDEEEVDGIGAVAELARAAEALQLNSYPACPQPERAIGMAAHTDSGFLTVLHQSAGAGGLQVLREDGGSGLCRWVAVPPRPDALVVNVGDLFHLLSNGRFKNVRHRAVVNRFDHRVSAAYFIGPPDHLKIGPINKLVDMGLGPIFRPVTWPEYLGLRTRLFDKALDALKLHN